MFLCSAVTYITTRRDTTGFPLHSNKEEGQVNWIVKFYFFLPELEGKARDVGQLLVPVEGFSLGRG